MNAEDELHELRRKLSIAEARIRVQDRILNQLPKTIDGSSILPGMQVYVPFSGIRVSRSGVRADGYQEDTVDYMQCVRGAIKYRLACNPGVSSQPCYASAEECIRANPKNKLDAERMLELATANSEKFRHSSQTKGGMTC